MKLSLLDVAQAVGGQPAGSGRIYELLSYEIDGVSTDSRGDLTGKLFIPLVGDNFDGHDYIEAALQNGAVGALSARTDLPAGLPILFVSDTRKALRDLAEDYRQNFHIPVVAVTGSAGKTTTKDMIACVLAEKFNTLKTEGNFNNEVGLPLTVFRLEKEHECAVLEMGMNHFGEIHNLSKIARPDICVITNVGVAHMENLGSREGILKAKSEIFDYMSDDGCKITGDDNMLSQLPADMRCGFAEANDVFAKNIEDNGLDGVSAVIVNKDIEIPISLSQPGLHTLQNALVAAAVGIRLGLSADEIKRGIEKFTPGKMRMNISRSANGLRIIDDTYNANPTSMKASLDILATAEGRKVCILGDMLELGSFENLLHGEIGMYAVKIDIDVILCIGTLSKHMCEGAEFLADKFKRPDKIIRHYADRDSLTASELQSLLKPGDTVLVKASRGMRLEKTVEMLSQLRIEH